jgi:hypothetical protein
MPQRPSRQRLISNAVGSWNEIMTMERLLQMTGTSYRLPVPEKIMLSGVGIHWTLAD